MYPEAAKKIIDNGIAETEYRREQERKFLSAQIKEKKKRSIFRFFPSFIDDNMWLLFNRKWAYSSRFSIIWNNSSRYHWLVYRKRKKIKK